jgi:Flp pilus assembly protein TadG
VSRLLAAAERRRRIAHRRRLAGERGQGLVEFALIVPLFLLILVTMIDFGMGFYTNLVVQYASREGARVGAALASGSSTLPCAQVDDYVMAAVQRVLESAGLAIDLNATGGGGVSWIRIYKADASGAGWTSSLKNEWRFSAGGGPTVDGRVLDFAKQGTDGWSACSRSNGTPPDSIGVAINYTYAWITPIASITKLVPTFAPLSQLTFIDKTVMALNPTYP